LHADPPPRGAVAPAPARYRSVAAPRRHLRPAAGHQDAEVGTPGGRAAGTRDGDGAAAPRRHHAAAKDIDAIVVGRGAGAAALAGVGGAHASARLLRTAALQPD